MTTGRYSGKGIYLDANATTPVLASSAQAALQVMERFYGNPSSAHITGIQAKHILKRARELAHRVLGTTSGQIFFNSGATEGLQTDILSALHDLRGRQIDDLVLAYGATEHKAVPRTLQHWNEILNLKASVVEIPVDRKGRLDLAAIESLADNLGLICTMAVNNETGVIQDLDLLHQFVRRTRALWLIDGVQALGKLSLRLGEWGVDYAVFSGHKLYAPKGIGMLYVREGSPYTPLIAGGGQEDGARSGTENVPGIAAMSVILEFLTDPDQAVFRSNQQLFEFRDKFVQTLKELFTGVVFNTPIDISVPTTINFSVKGFSSKELMDLFDAADIRMSAGSACSSGMKSSFVLDAMGLEKWQSESAIRLSFGPAITRAEVDEACQRIRHAVGALANSCLLSVDGGSQRDLRHGLVLVGYGGATSLLYIDSTAKSCIIISPQQFLQERIVNFIACQGLQVMAVLSGTEQGAAAAREFSEQLIGAEFESDTWGVSRRSSAQHFTLMNDIYTGWKLDSRRVLLRVASQEDAIYLVCDTDASHVTRIEALVIDSAVLFTGAAIGEFLHTSGILPKLSKLRSLLTPWSFVVCPSDLQSITLVSDMFEGSQRVASQSHDLGNFQISPTDLSAFRAKNPTAEFIDVRESYEFHLLKNWHTPDLDVSPRNVPLSHFYQFLLALLAEQQGDHPLVFLCRSGARSSRIVQLLRGVGFYNTWNVTGGLAMCRMPAGFNDGIRDDRTPH